MGKLFYGTQTGTTSLVADTIAQYLGTLIEEVKCIQQASAKELEECDFLVLGGSTWGDGELTDDWQDFFPQLDKIDFTNKRVALFSLGDQASYSYNFVSAMKLLYDKLKSRNATIIADKVATEGFVFDHSESIVDGYFVGLVIDEVNEPELTEARIQEWSKQIQQSLLTASGR